MAKYWEVRIIVADEVIRKHHELAQEDPPSDSSLVSDWLSDLVIDAKAADEHAQDYAGPDCAASRELVFGRAGSASSAANFVFVRADPIDGDDAADAAAATEGSHPAGTRPNKYKAWRH